MDKKYSIKVNGWNVEFLKNVGNGHLITTILDSDGKVMQDTPLSKSKVRNLIEFLQSVEKEIKE